MLTAWPVRLSLAVCHSHPTAVSSCITSAEIWQVSIAPHAAVLQPEWNPIMVEGSLEVKLPTIWTDEKQSRAEAERRERLEERRVEEKE